MNLLFIVPIAATLLLAGCGDRGKTTSAPAARGGPLRVYATNYPVAFLARRIAGPAAEVILPVPADTDPAHWTPAAEQLRAFQGCDLLLVNGAGAEPWLATASLPLSRLTDTSAGFNGSHIAFEGTVTHRHGPGGGHNHGVTDFNVWLDPTLFARQASTVEEALVKRRPADETGLRQRAGALRADLQRLDRGLRSAAEGLRGQPVLASHPVYAYLARHCGWKLRSLHWEPGEPVSPEEWAAFDQLRAAHPARIMLWEGEPHDLVRAALETRGVAPVVFPTCSQPPATGDYLSVMGDNLARLRAASSSSSSTP